MKKDAEYMANKYTITQLRRYQGLVFEQQQMKVTEKEMENLQKREKMIALAIDIKSFGKTITSNDGLNLTFN